MRCAKKFMRGHGYIKKDFDVRRWAAPAFAEAALRELAEEDFADAAGEKPMPEGPAPRPGNLEESQRRAAGTGGPGKPRRKHAPRPPDFDPAQTP